MRMFICHDVRVYYEIETSHGHVAVMMMYRVVRMHRYDVHACYCRLGLRFLL